MLQDKSHRSLVQNSNQIQQYFSSEKEPTLWRALPALEELQTAWEKKRNSRQYALYKDALTGGLEKLRKYYSRLDEKPSFVLSLGKILNLLTYNSNKIIVLHPYYKLTYIKLAWGGPEEQAAEIAAGNPNAKDWQDEAKKIVEKTVSYSPVFMYNCDSSQNICRWLSTTKIGHLL